MNNATATPTARQLPANLPTKAAISWAIEDLPPELQDLTDDLDSFIAFEPSFVSFIPHCLRFSHAPRTAIVSEDVDGGTLYVE